MIHHFRLQSSRERKEARGVLLQPEDEVTSAMNLSGYNTALQNATLHFKGSIWSGHQKDEENPLCQIGSGGYVSGP